MTDFTPEMKRTLRERLDAIDSQLEQARDEAERGATADALARIARAIDMKHDALTIFPGVDVRPGVELPFFPVYDVFFDVDQGAFLVGQIVASVQATPGATADQIRELSARLKNTIDELSVNLLRRFGLADPGPGADVRQIIDALK